MAIIDDLSSSPGSIDEVANVHLAEKKRVKMIINQSWN